MSSIQPKTLKDHLFLTSSTWAIFKQFNFQAVTSQLITLSKLRLTLNNQLCKQFMFMELQAYQFLLVISLEANLLIQQLSQHTWTIIMPMDQQHQIQLTYHRTSSEFMMLPWQLSLLLILRTITCSMTAWSTLNQPIQLATTLATLALHTLLGVRSKAVYITLTMSSQRYRAVPTQMSTLTKEDWCTWGMSVHCRWSLVMSHTWLHHLVEVLSTLREVPHLRNQLWIFQVVFSLIVPQLIRAGFSLSATTT